MKCFDFETALMDFLVYVKDQMSEGGYREACIVSFHAEHIIQLLHGVLVAQKKRCVFYTKSILHFTCLSLGSSRVDRVANLKTNFSYFRA